MDLLKERCNFVQKKGQKYVELIVTCDDPELSDNDDGDEYTNLPSVFLELWCVCLYSVYVVIPEMPLQMPPHFILPRTGCRLCFGVNSAQILSASVDTHAVLQVFER